MKLSFLVHRMGFGFLGGLATSDLRDQIAGRWLVCGLLSLAWIAPQAHANPVLNILTQTQRLDSALVEEFEASRKVAVRVEFVSSPLDYETRVRALPNSWDLILADEHRLVTLSLAKILKTLPESVSIPPNLAGLEKRARANEDGKSYINLMADPMGLMFLNRTKMGAGPLGWNWIIQPSLNPLWRSRVALYSDERLNLMAAAAATGVEFPAESEEGHRKVFNWLSQAQLQGRSASVSSMITAFLAEKYVVGLAWQSDFLQASRYVKDLAFAVPTEGTYVERIGIGLVADSRNEVLAADFIKFIHERRDQLAQRRGLLPLHFREFQGSDVRNWRIFADDVPRLKELTAGLTRLRKEKDARTARAR